MVQCRPIKRLLVANRGEIATRILSAARELDIVTFAIYSDEDLSHTVNATHRIRLKSPGSYLDIAELIEVVRKHDIDAVHPGYGFLSESADFAQRMSDEANVLVVGPGANILSQTGDKLQARLLAESCNVPTLPALRTPTNDVRHIEAFAKDVGFPLMIKAVDGGGGRGIRLVSEQKDLATSVTRATEESPSKQVFAEKAAIHGYRHIEVQIIGDSQGQITHLWERECSIQRRYQKIVEMAPSSFANDKLTAEIIKSAMRMAQKIGYLSLGTFEFLANPDTSEYYFLEVNPRLQVEHTVTESISLRDLVQAQLRIAQGETLQDLSLFNRPKSQTERPSLFSIQLRITAEDVERGWSLSIGKIQSFNFPSGNGIRVDTHLVHGMPATVSTDFDSLVAKLIITAPTWKEAVSKARRALEDTHITGIKTNLYLLRAIVIHKDFIAGACDTRWLEQEQSELLTSTRQLEAAQRSATTTIPTATSSTASATALAASSMILRKGDAWSMTLQPSLASGASKTAPTENHLQLTKILRNDFPNLLSAEVAFTTPGQGAKTYTMQLQSTSASASAVSSQHRKGSPDNPKHVIIPFSGKLVELLVDEGDYVKAGDVLCVVKQMKMELEVRAHKSGLVTWAADAEDGEDVAEGMLVAVVEDERVEAKL